MGRGQVYNNIIGYFLGLYTFIRCLSGIKREFYAKCITEDTKWDYMTCPRWDSDAVNNKAHVTIAG